MILTLLITFVFSMGIIIEFLNLFIISVHLRKLIKGKRMIFYDFYLKHELRKKSFHSKCTIYKKSQDTLKSLRMSFLLCHGSSVNYIHLKHIKREVKAWLKRDESMTITLVIITWISLLKLSCSVDQKMILLKKEEIARA